MMLQIKMFDINIATMVKRFYLMMAIALILGFAQQWILMAFITVPFVVINLLGLSFNRKTKKAATTKVIPHTLKKVLPKAA